MAVGAQGPTDLMAFSGGSVQGHLSRPEFDEHNEYYERRLLGCQAFFATRRDNGYPADTP